jgi:hypothetical protein
MSLAAAAWETAPFLNRRSDPGALAKAIRLWQTSGSTALNDAYDPYGDASLQRQGIDPKRVPAALRGAGELGLQWWNPSNRVVGGLAKVVGQRGAEILNYGRAASPAIENAARIGEGAVQHFAGPLEHVAQTAKEATGATLRAMVGAATKAGLPFAAVFDRYLEAGLPQRGGLPYLHAALGAQAAPDHAKAVAERQFSKHFDGLTLAQAREVQKLSHSTEAEPVARDAQVPEPKKGPSLAQRAVGVRSIINAYDAAEVALGLRKPEDIIGDNQYYPMRAFNKKRVYGNDALQKAAEAGDELELASVVRQNYAGGGKFKAGLSPTMRKRLPPITDPAIEALLHPEYDPAYQVIQHYGDVAAKIANEQHRVGLETLPNINPATGVQRTIAVPGIGTLPATARMDLIYQMPDPANPGAMLNFGVGEAGHKAMENYIKREAAGAARAKATADPRTAGLAKALGISPAAVARTRNVATGPAYARLLEARKAAGAAGKVPGRLMNVSGARVSGPLGRIAQTAQRTAADLAASTGALGAKEAENAAAAAKAAENAQTLREAERVNREQAATAQPPPTAAEMRQQAEGLARQEHAVAMEQYQNVAQHLFERGKRTTKEIGADGKPVVKSVTYGIVEPDWVKIGGRYVPAGEFADVPTRYLDLSKRPAPHVQGDISGQVETIRGNVDDLATQAGLASGDDLIRWMERNPTPPRLNAHLEAAMKNVQGASGTEDPAELQRFADLMRDEAARQAAEAGHRAFAASEFGPSIRGVLGAGERAQQGLAGVAEQATKARGVAAESAEQAAKRADDRAAAWKAATARAKAATAFEKITREYLSDELEDVRQRVRAVAVKAPEGYVKESDLGLASPTGREKALDEPFAELYKRRDNPIPDTPQTRALIASFSLMNRLARAGVVLVPTVHAINNLGTHYIAEGGDPEQMGRILTGRARFDDDLKTRAYKSGAVSETGQRTFSPTDERGFHATVDRGERARMAGAKAPGPLRRVVEGAHRVQLEAGRPYNAMTDWLFHTVEQGYGFDLFDRFTKAGMSDGAAALRVRQALGRFDSLSGIERVASNLFYFYPWMKTVIPFWVKKGLLDPKWWSAPVQAIATSNKAQGYDDPSRAFQATAGRDAAGNWRVATLPVPQRVAEPLAKLGRIPFDLAAAARNEPGAMAGAGEDARAPFDYVTGHFSVPAAIIKEGIEAAASGKEGPAPWNLFATPKKASERGKLAHVLSNTAGAFIAPYSRLQDAAKDPLGAFGGMALGSFVHGVPPAYLKKLDNSIQNAYDAGDTATAQRLEAGRAALIARMQGTPLAPLPVATPTAAGANPYLRP